MVRCLAACMQPGRRFRQTPECALNAVFMQITRYFEFCAGGRCLARV